jgi:hypothetical protein
VALKVAHDKSLEAIAGRMQKPIRTIRYHARLEMPEMRAENGWVMFQKYRKALKEEDVEQGLDVTSEFVSCASWHRLINLQTGCLTQQRRIVLRIKHVWTAAKPKKNNTQHWPTFTSGTRERTLRVLIQRSSSGLGQEGWNMRATV